MSYEDLVIAQYYTPENFGAAVWIPQLASYLTKMSHEVSIVTGFPNIPDGVIFDGYRGKLFQRERLEGVEVIRTWLYTSPDKSFWPKLL